MSIRAVSVHVTSADLLYLLYYLTSVTSICCTNIICEDATIVYTAILVSRLHLDLDCGWKFATYYPDRYMINIYVAERPKWNHNDLRVIMMFNASIRCQKPRRQGVPSPGWQSPPSLRAASCATRAREEGYHLDLGSFALYPTAACRSPA